MPALAIIHGDINHPLEVGRYLDVPLHQGADMTSSESADEVAVLEDDILAGPILEIGARFASAFIICCTFPEVSASGGPAHEALNEPADFWA